MRLGTPNQRHSLEIEHRLTKPKTPQTNGMVERFNGRLEQVLRTHRFNSRNDLESTLHRYVWLYNEHLPQKALEHVAPLDALKRWQKLQPEPPRVSWRPVGLSQAATMED